MTEHLTSNLYMQKYWYMWFPFCPFYNKLNLVAAIGNKIVDTFTFLTPYFVTVIPFSPPSLSFQPPFPPDNVVPQLL